jgi:hypothetical protein
MRCTGARMVNTGYKLSKHQDLHLNDTNALRFRSLLRHILHRVANLHYFHRHIYHLFQTYYLRAEGGIVNFWEVGT